MRNLSKLGVNKNYVVSEEGEVFNTKTGKKLNPWVNTSGYSAVILKVGDKFKNFSVHRLVATAYIDNPEELSQVNHLDGNKQNNLVSNLEWVSPKGNSKHSVENGLRPPPFMTEDSIKPETTEFDWRSNMKTGDEWTEPEARAAALMLEEGYRVCDVSGLLGLNRRCIQFMRDGERKWGMLALEYDFSKIRRKAKMSVESIRKVCEYLQEGKSINGVAELLGVDRKIVSSIKARKSHTLISSEYHW